MGIVPCADYYQCTFNDGKNISARNRALFRLSAVTRGMEVFLLCSRGFRYSPARRAIDTTTNRKRTFGSGVREGRTLFPVPGSQSAPKRINDNNSQRPQIIPFHPATLSLTLPLFLRRIFHLYIYRTHLRPVNHSIKIISPPRRYPPLFLQTEGPNARVALSYFLQLTPCRLSVRFIRKCNLIFDPISCVRNTGTPAKNGITRGCDRSGKKIKGKSGEEDAPRPAGRLFDLRCYNHSYSNSERENYARQSGLNGENKFGSPQSPKILLTPPYTHP